MIFINICFSINFLLSSQNGQEASKGKAEN